MLEVDPPPRLVLASTSRYRVGLLERIGIAFSQRAPDVDERAYDEQFLGSGAEAFAQMLAAAKADSVAAMVRDEGPRPGSSWVLGADQLAILPGDPPQLLHKPGTAERAIEQLMQLAGREHQLVTGVALCEVVPSASSGRRFAGADRVVLRMRAFDRAEATDYVRAYAPLDCAGSYRIEDAGIRLFETIEGSADPTSIIGLPMLLVTRLFRQAGLLPR